MTSREILNRARQLPKPIVCSSQRIGRIGVPFRFATAVIMLGRRYGSYPRTHYRL